MFGPHAPLMIQAGDVQDFGGVSMVYTGYGWTTNAQTQAIDAAARNQMETQMPGGYESPGIAGPAGFSPLDPAPWPPKDTDRIAGMGFQCIPSDWPDPQSGYYSFGLANIPPRCEDLNAAQASQIPFGSAFIGLTNERVMIDNQGQIVGTSPLSAPGRVTFVPSAWTPDFRAQNPNIGAANPIAAPPPAALGQSNRTPDLVTTGVIPTDTTRGILTGTTAITAPGGSLNGIGVPNVGNGFTANAPNLHAEKPAQQNNTMMYMMLAIVAIMVFAMTSRG